MDGVGSATERRERGFVLFLAVGIFLSLLGVDPGAGDGRYLYRSAQIVTLFEATAVGLYLFFFPLRRTFFRNPWSRLLLGWYLVVLYAYVASPLYAPGNPLALNRLLPTLLHPLFFLIVWDLLLRFPRGALPLLLSIFFAGVANLLVWIVPQSVCPLNDNIRRIGYLSLVSIIAGMGIYALLRVAWQKVSVAAMSGGMLLLLVWLGGRASLGALILAVVLLLLSRPSVRFGRVLLVPVLFAGMLFLFWRADIGFGYLDDMLRRTFSGTAEKILSGRLEVWNLAWKHILSTPLFGEGPQAYYFYPGRSGTVIHAHNFLLQFFGEWGIVGGGIFLTLLGYLLWRGWEGCRRVLGACSPSRRTALAGIVALGFAGLFGGTFYVPETSLSLTVFFALWSADNV